MLSTSCAKANEQEIKIEIIKVNSCFISITTFNDSNSIFINRGRSNKDNVGFFMSVRYPKFKKSLMVNSLH